MLKHLYIKNFTLIDQLDIDFHPGFSVITGETGAGKSIILGAIGLLLGNRADSKLVKRPQGDDRRTVKCTIEAHFDLSRYDFAPFFEENDLDFDPDDTIIRRELTSTGKSRSFINDMPVSQQLMRQLGEQLIDIHSQHQNLLLQKDDFQLNVVDIIADNGQDRAAFSEAFTRYREAEQRLRSLEKQIEASEQNRDFLQFQYNELSAAQLVEGEQEQLEQEGETLNHAGEIKTAIYTADNLLSGDDRGAVMQVRMAAQQLQSIASVYPKTQELANRLDSVHIELDDIAHEVAADMESIDFDPSRQDAIIARLDQIYSLQQKYRVSTVAELLQLQASIHQQLESIENADGDLALLRQEVADQEKLCREKAQQLTLSRTASARKVEAEMHARLVPLGIPNVRFEVEVKPAPLSASGADHVVFLFSANRGTPLQPVSQVASGGEIARVMLSLKAMISGTIKLPTIIFDEIDTGVSGKIAEKMAMIMEEMGAGGRQVISITHLPQIASRGLHHYKVEKTDTPEGTESHMRQLSADERVGEIAMMLSGENVTEAALENARALLSTH